MSSTVISVEHLSKAYRLGQIGTGTLTNDLKVWWAKARGKPNPLLKIGQRDYSAASRPPSSVLGPPPSASVPRPSSFVSGRPSTKNDKRKTMNDDVVWALNDVSFSVKQGEVLGIIGRNGAGKSTILKILSRITAPTQGEVKVKGRIASLLEVGTGFHAELTGRENTYLNGAILGMTKAEVDKKFDEIVAFSEVEQFIDTPVKRYSSGMYVRLAFAVAAHLEPEVLLVDEVLAVGDAAFQKKCLGKMGEVAKGGRTVLFVSHNMAAVSTLCHNAFWIDRGNLRTIGPTSRIVSEYLASSSADERDCVCFDGEGRHKGHEVVIVSVRRTPAGRVTNGDPITLTFQLRANRDTECNLSFYVYREGMLAFVVSDFSNAARDGLLKAGHVYEASLAMPAHLLNPGFHTFGFAVSDKGGNHRQFASVQEVLPCSIDDDMVRRGGTYLLGWSGAVSPILPISMEELT